MITDIDKRFFSADTRSKYADKGVALPDGGTCDSVTPCRSDSQPMTPPTTGTVVDSQADAVIADVNSPKRTHRLHDDVKASASAHHATRHDPWRGVSRTGHDQITTVAQVRFAGSTSSRWMSTRPCCKRKVACVRSARVSNKANAHAICSLTMTTRLER